MDRRQLYLHFFTERSIDRDVFVRCPVCDRRSIISEYKPSIGGDPRQYGLRCPLCNEFYGIRDGTNLSRCCEV